MKLPAAIFLIPVIRKIITHRRLYAAYTMVTGQVERKINPGFSLQISTIGIISPRHLLPLVVLSPSHIKSFITIIGSNINDRKPTLISKRQFAVMVTFIIIPASLHNSRVQGVLRHDGRPRFNDRTQIGSARVHSFGHIIIERRPTMNLESMHTLPITLGLKIHRFQTSRIQIKFLLSGQSLHKGHRDRTIKICLLH